MTNKQVISSYKDFSAEIYELLLLRGKP